METQKKKRKLDGSRTHDGILRILLTSPLSKVHTFRQR